MIKKSLTEWIYWSLVSRLKENGLSTGVGMEDCVKIMDAITETDEISGHIAEVGVAEGGSAIIICNTIEFIKSQKEIHLFDTFEGLPEPGIEDKGAFLKGQYATDYEKVKGFFEKYPNTILHKGIFPATGELIKEKMFSFVHLDADLYKSTYDSLDFFWPRMTLGGIIISHDYQTEPGIKRAFYDYFRENIPIETPGKSQCLVVKQ